MIDSKQLKIKGEVSISSNNENIFKENNEIILGNALEILLSSLGTQQNIGIDILRVSGVTGTVDIGITESLVTVTDNSVTFKATVKESDFNGYINKLELISSNSGKIFSRKQSLNVFKDDTNRLQVSWKIILEFN